MTSNMPDRRRTSSCRQKFCEFFRPLRIEWLEDRTLLAITPQLLLDINNNVQQDVRVSGAIVQVGSAVFFAGYAGGNDTELWQIDEFSPAPFRVKDIRPGTAGSNPANLTNINGTLFFTANDGTNGFELWRTDAAEGAVLIKDILTGAGNSSNPTSLTNVGGTLYFRANDGANGYELWKSDGTPGGTTLVKDINQAAGVGSYPGELTNLNGTLYFRANDGINGVELWKSNGSGAGTSLVKNIAPGSARSNPGFLTNVNGTLFFSANDGTHGYELWTTDVVAGAVLVKDIRATGNQHSYPQYLVNVSGTLFFAATDGTNGFELWRSNGTEGSTVKIPVPGFSGNLRDLTNVGGTLFFNSSVGTNGAGLWKSDGTSGGTILVKDINPVFGDSSPSSITDVNGTAFFRANDGTHGYELWKSDGTPSGTVLVKDINAGPAPNSPLSLVNVNGKLLFAANDGTNGYELWRSDGTAAGTVLLSRTTYGSDPASFTTVGNITYFSANDGPHGNELWRTDGTSAGTMLVYDYSGQGGQFFYGISPRLLTNVNGTLFFTADDGPNGRELWKSDGNFGGTTMVKNIAATGGSNPKFLTNVNGTLYFTADNGPNGRELWKSDGTTGGTMMVKDINPGLVPYGPYNLTNVNGTLFFEGNEGVNGYELWKSDGTPTGTVLVKDIRTGSESSGPFYLTNVSGQLYFSANDGIHGRELWTSNGTAGGTYLHVESAAGAFNGYPSNITNVNGILFFSAYDETGKLGIWTNGFPPRAVKTDLKFSSGFRPQLENVNGTLYFTAAYGTELWKSSYDALNGDITTTLVKEINFISLFPTFANVDGTLFFTASDFIHGAELWKSNGTAAGTFQVADIAPQNVSSYPLSIKYQSGRVLFTADDGLHGNELWSATLYDLGDAPDTYGTTLADDGARHLSLGPQLGPTRDEETNAASGFGGDGADEDGLVTSALKRGAMSSVTVDVYTDGSTAKLDGWIDFDQSGFFSPSEKVIDSRTVDPGRTQLTFPVPQNARIGYTAARFRISTDGGLGPTGLAPDGEVEDYALTISQDLAVTLPAGNGADKVAIRENGANVEIFDVNAQTVLASSPLGFTNSVIVNGAPFEIDEIAVDYAFGGFFTVPGGIVLDGGTDVGDLLTVVGKADGLLTTSVVYVSRGLALGFATLRTQYAGFNDEIRFTNFEPLTIDNISVLEVDGNLDIRNDTLTVTATSFVKLGTQTNIAGGSINAPGGVTLAAGQLLRGQGSIVGRVAADIGSTIEATGSLTMGDASSPAGFTTRGELRVLNNTVTLLDSNQVVLGSLTRLGNGGSAGTLNAANGAVLDFGNNIVGFGTLNTPNSVLKPLINNGSIAGDSNTNKITLPGYVKGVGSLDFVNITGTNSPGFSPATVYYGSVAYDPAAKLIAELGGKTPGSFDQQIYSGTADLSGKLDLQLINGYAPDVGDTFTLVSAAGGVHGTFTSQTTPSLPEFWSWKLAYGANDLTTSVVSSRPLHNSRFKWDVNVDTFVAADDVVAIINYINAKGSGKIPDGTPYGKPFCDVDGDENVVATDVVVIINYINAGRQQGGEAEAGQRMGGGEQATGNSDVMALLAMDVAEQAVKKRK